MKDITELAQIVDREAVEAIRTMESASDNKLDTLLMEALHDRDVVSQMIALFTMLLDEGTEEAFIRLMAGNHQVETRIVMILSEREHRA